jgi:bacteriocin-like protein
MKRSQTPTQKHPQARQQPPRAKEHPQAVQELTEEQLQQVVGGISPDPIIPGGPPIFPPDETGTQIIVIGG